MQREFFSKCFPTRLLAQEVALPSARNLGIVFDSAFNFKSHISGISHACYYHMRDSIILGTSDDIFLDI